MMEELTGGLERVGITLDCEAAHRPEFEYTTTLWRRRDAKLEPFTPPPPTMDGCTCTHCCVDSLDCTCLYGSSSFPYKKQDDADDGALVLDLDRPDPTSIFECSSNCACTDDTCQLRLVQNKGLDVPLTVKWDEKKGWAVFALASIARGSYICTYTGELVSTLDATERYKALSQTRQMNYILTARETLADGRVYCTHIDATAKGNASRLFNHSCSPSLQVELVHLGGSIVPKVAFFAKQSLKCGDELTFRYGGDDQSDDVSDRVCHCGSWDCRGFLPRQLL